MTVKYPDSYLLMFQLHNTYISVSPDVQGHMLAVFVSVDHKYSNQFFFSDAGSSAALVSSVSIDSAVG